MSKEEHREENDGGTKARDFEGKNACLLDGRNENTAAPSWITHATAQRTKRRKKDGVRWDRRLLIKAPSIEIRLDNTRKVLLSNKMPLVDAPLARQTYRQGTFPGVHTSQTEEKREEEHSE